MTDILAVGGVLSILLAIIKIYEFLKNRPRLYVTPNLTSSPEIGNTITIENPSDHSFIINYWELVWKNGLKFWQKEELCESPEPGHGSVSF